MKVDYQIMYSILNFDYELKSLNQDYESCVINKDNLYFYNVINDIINKVSINILTNYNYKKNDTTPKLRNNKEKRISLLLRQKKIFINFLLRYHNFDNTYNENLYKNEKRININKNANIKNILLKKLNDIIPLSIIYKNYSKYKLFYTWENIIDVINYIENNI